MIGEKSLKTCFLLNNSPSLTPSVLHKPGRNLEIDEAVQQGYLFGNQSQNWDLLSFFIVWEVLKGPPISLFPCPRHPLNKWAQVSLKGEMSTAKKKEIKKKKKDSKRGKKSNKYTGTVQKIFWRAEKVICLYIIKFQFSRLANTHALVI